MAPPRKDPEMRRLQGSKARPRHRHEVVTDALPGLDLGPIAPPRGLSAAERRYWRQFAGLLASARLLTAADVETLADYCRCCAAVDDRSQRARRELAKPRPDVHGVRVWDVSLRQWATQKAKLAAVLGLTPTARARLGWTGQQASSAPSAPRSPLAQLQARAVSLRVDHPPMNPLDKFLNRKRRLQTEPDDGAA